MIKIGDFVTQYSAGYWQLIELKPKIADEDYTDSNGKTHKKGDVIGQWAILKKAFTPKMKPKIDFDYADSFWLKPVGDEVQFSIEQYFADNPSFKEKYENAILKLNPSIMNCWMNLPEKEEEQFREAMRSLPKSYTMEEFWHKFKKYKKYISTPPTTYLINFFAYPWDINENGDIVYIGCVLEKL